MNSSIEHHPNAFIGCNFAPNITCTLQTCCLAQSTFLYLPSLAGNLFFTIFFAVFLIPQLGLGIYYRTWGYMTGMLIGLILESGGYISKIVLHYNPFNYNAFLAYLILITIAPVFISAAIYLTLARLIVLYGANTSRFAPRTIAVTFMTSDFLSLVLQATGGAITDEATPGTPLRQTGVDIMIAGLILQAVSLTAFLLVCADCAWRAYRGVRDVNPEKRRVRSRAYFKAFVAALMLAAVVILVRSVFRVAELWTGFTGVLWNDETYFFVLDGAMIAIATLALTCFHPGAAFDGYWTQANWSFKKQEQDRSHEWMKQEGQILPGSPNQE